ncbi:hypothetical protein KJ973_02640 [Patescibacteria group bacterium]|nr:hypothetical protein [Patescibacteria group bacterium]MBU1247020.1 hypothetical protein [Patescibacteria group bacterium]MBU1519561.1 hypothetical protein [Patescibacteria group bacterium]MBU1730611.1 hypothetical protein [Patescibacteria group bacterium]MBU1956077.1 hypothetical protein [Patescibacteria group bacterium]
MTKSKSSQTLISIEEVKEGIIILKDGSMRMLLMASSINFALKSEDEQKGVLYQFQNFLNSLDFSTQIYIQSRRLDIKPYLALLQTLFKKDMPELMQIQIREYIEFVRSFTENTNIMSKTFFLVIPYHPGFSSQKIAGGFFSKKSSASQKEEASFEYFEECRSQLEQRANVVRQGLSRAGIRTTPLGTEEIIELFYKIFNPANANREIN